MPNRVDYPFGLVTPSATYRQVVNARVSCNSQIFTSFLGGEPTPRWQGIFGQRPEVEFTTSNLGVAFAEMPSYFVGYSALNVDFYSRQGQLAGFRKTLATAGHHRFRMFNSMICCGSLDLPHQGDGTLTMMVTPYYDGTNEPIVMTDGVSLDALGSGTLEHYGVGPVLVNDTLLANAIPGVQRCTVDFNIVKEQLGGENEPWDRWVSGNELRPVVSIQTKRVREMEIMGLDGKELFALTIYGRAYRIDSTGGVTRIPNNVGAHLKFTFGGGGLIHVSGVTANGPTATIDATIMIETRASSTDGVPLVVQVNQQIT